MSTIAYLVLAAATPTTAPEDTWYSPGTVGFLGTFFVVAMSVLLIFDMVRRVRRVRYRAEIQERLAQEQAAAQKKASKPASGSSKSSQPAANKVQRSRPAPPPKPKRD